MSSVGFASLAFLLASIAAAQTSVPDHAAAAGGTDAVPAAPQEKAVSPAVPPSHVPTNFPPHAVPKPAAPAEKPYARHHQPKHEQPLLLADSRWHVAAAGQYAFPSDADFWSDAVGGELRLYRWFKPQWAAALTFGFADWSPASEVAFPTDIRMVIEPTFSGTAMTYAPGASVFYRPAAEWKRFHLLLEAGLRYVFVDSSLEFTWQYEDHYGNEQTVTSMVTIDDRVMAVAGVEAWRPINERVSFFLGGGYQADLSAGDSNWLGQDFANELNAAVVRVGLNF